MVISYGETSGFTAVREKELALVNGGKGAGGGGGGGGRANYGPSSSPTAGYSTGEAHRTTGSHNGGTLSPSYYTGGHYLTNNNYDTYNRNGDYGKMGGIITPIDVVGAYESDQIDALMRK